MKNVIYFFIGLALIILQNSILNFMSFFGVTFDFLLVYIIIIAINVGNDRAGILGLVLGLIQDLTVGRVLGVNALFYLFLGYGLGSLKDLVFKDNIITPLSLGTVGAIIKSLFTYFVLGAFGRSVEVREVLMKIFVIIPLANSFLTVVFYKKTKKYILKLENMAR